MYVCVNGVTIFEQISWKKRAFRSLVSILTARQTGRDAVFSVEIPMFLISSKDSMSNVRRQILVATRSLI